MSGVRLLDAAWRPVRSLCGPAPDAGPGPPLRHDGMAIGSRHPLVRPWNPSPPVHHAPSESHPMPEEVFRPVYHPAGYDGGLRIALQDVRTGRWISMRDLLAGTPTWAQWTQRTQVLAAVAAGSNVVE